MQLLKILRSVLFPSRICMLRSKNVGILGRLVLRILIEDLGCENCRNWQNVAAPNRPADFILANYVVNAIHILWHLYSTNLFLTSKTAVRFYISLGASNACQMYWQ